MKLNQSLVQVKLLIAHHWVNEPQMHLLQDGLKEDKLSKMDVLLID